MSPAGHLVATGTAQHGTSVGHSRLPRASFLAALLLVCRALGLPFWTKFVEPVRGDLPAHCLVRHVLGEWEIQEGLWLPCKGELTAAAAQLHDPYCGYGVPDKIDAHDPMTPPNISRSFHLLRTSRFTLHPDFRVDFDDGSTGVWTLVYDEGLHFEVTTPQSRRFFAFFKYEVAPDGRNLAWSYCHTTLVGWWDRVPQGDAVRQSLEPTPPAYDVPELVVPETPADQLLHSLKRGCWWGRKVGEDLSVPTNEVPKERRTPLDVPIWPTSLPPDIQSVAAVVRKSLSTDAPWEPVEDDYIEIRGRKLRSIQEVWENAGNQPLLMSRQHIEGRRATVKASLPLHVLSGVQPFGSPAGSEPPWRTIREFDWSNEEHVALRIGRRRSVVPDAPNQGRCGSCYAISTGTVLTSRLWIRYAANDDVFGKINVSAFQGTSCNVYNQGCGGGYVFLALKFGQEHGFRTEECVQEYTREAHHRSSPLSPSLQTCHDLGGQLGTSAYGCRAPPARSSLPESCSVSIKVASWQYVGGVYGGCSEDAMLRTLWEHGPMAASIEPTVAFTVYRKGVFKSAYNSLVQKGENWVWEKVDHAVVVVGWGWARHGDKWLPYWKVRNSWGARWGEGGYARVIRGVNEMAIERVAVVGEVSLFRDGKHIPPTPAKEPTTSQLAANSSTEPSGNREFSVETLPTLRGVTVMRAARTHQPSEDDREAGESESEAASEQAGAPEDADESRIDAKFAAPQPSFLSQSVKRHRT